MQKTTFIHVAEAALAGLPARVRGDQALVHCLVLHASNKGQEKRQIHERVVAQFNGVVANDKAKHVNETKSESAQGHGSGPLLLCGGLFELVQPQHAIKASGVGSELFLGQPLDLQLAGIRDDPGPHPVTDGALIAAQRISRQLLIAVVAGNLFRGHGEIMALAIWQLP